MRKLSACLTAAIVSLASTASAHPHPSGDPWERIERFEWSTSKGRLGVMVTSMTPELRKYFGAPSERGVLVVNVEPGSPAASAGIKVGDVLTSVRGEAIDDATDVIAALAVTKQGDKVKVDLVRDKKALSIDATMSSGSLSSSLDWLREVVPWWFDFKNLTQQPGSAQPTSST